MREYFVLDVLLGGRVHVLHFACFGIFIFSAVCRSSGAVLALIVFSSSTYGLVGAISSFLQRKGIYCLSSVWTNGRHHVFAHHGKANLGSFLSENTSISYSFEPT